MSTLQEQLVKKQKELKDITGDIERLKEAITYFSMVVPAPRLRVQSWPDARLCQVGRSVYQWINIADGSYNRLSDHKIKDVGDFFCINVAAIQAADPDHTIYVVSSSDE